MWEGPHIYRRVTGDVAKEMRRRRESYVTVCKRDRTLMVDKDGKGWKGRRRSDLHAAPMMQSTAAGLSSEGWSMKQGSFTEMQNAQTQSSLSLYSALIQ